MPQALQRALTLLQWGKLAEAEHLYQQILKVDPAQFDALHLLGIIKVRQGNNQQGVNFMSEALRIRPNAAETHSNLGIALRNLNRLDDALMSYDKALAIKPDYPEALNNRGNALLGLNRYDEAIASYDKAIAIKPDYAEALDHRGAILLTQGKIEEAISCCRRALAIEPDNHSIHSNLIFALNFDPAATAAEHQAERARWDEQHAKRFAAAVPPHTNHPDPDRRLRVGYVSSHFRDQAATYAFGGVLLCHDRKWFDVTCYSDTLREDDITARFRSSVSKWHHTMGLSDDELADLIRADGIDILVDLVGHMTGHRLVVFARKPAPVQVTAWGEPTGTGLKTMDYLLADPVLVTGAERGLLAERVVDLPNFLGYWTPDPLPEPGALPARAQGYVTFGSFNRISKVLDPVLRSWAAVLRALPEAHLVLKDRALADFNQRARILAILADEGVTAERVMLLGQSDRAAHYAAYQAIDIALDPFPHGGGMTTLDALWMGVPVVTWPGRTISSRLAAANLTALGLTDFIATDPETYVQLAVVKATNLDALARLRASLRQRVADSAFGDSIRYTRAVEAAYRLMWQRWCADAKNRLA